MKNKLNIVIKQTYDDNLLNNYPQDPFGDILIKTTNKQLKLALSYLSLDSQYFNKLNINTSEINLSNLQQQPLLQILRALYGDTLVVNTIQRLQKIYYIIKYLQIDDYHNNMIKYLQNHKNITHSIQFIQFGYKNHILIQQINKHHFTNHLQQLQSSLNYLQLNCISSSTINLLLNTYSLHKNIQDLKNVSNVLENYFNRNGLNSFSYFQQFNDITILQQIWQHFHHKFYFDSQLLRQPLKRSQQRQIAQRQSLQKSGFQRSFIQRHPQSNSLQKPSFQRMDQSPTHKQPQKKQKKLINPFNNWKVVPINEQKYRIIQDLTKMSIDEKREYKKSLQRELKQKIDEIMQLQQEIQQQRKIENSQFLLHSLQQPQFSIYRQQMIGKLKRT